MATPVVQLAGERAAATPRLSAVRRANGPHVLVTVNGPGEIAAWLYPFAHALQDRVPDATLTAALLPCAFSSGREREVLDAMDGIDRVVAPDESMRWIVRGAAPANLTRHPDVAVHFGGELALSVALARRLRVPVLAYEEERVRWAGLLDRVCVRDERAARGRDDDRVRIVGNLMVDAARRRVPRRIPSREVSTVALLPGSRPYFVRQLLPLFLRAAAELSRVHPGLRFVLAKSDFVTLHEIRECLQSRADRIVAGDDGEVRVAPNDNVTTIVSSAGLEVDVLTPEGAMHRADMAVTIPGTNTAELAALGIPMLLVLPTYRLHALPLPGIAGHMGGVPLVGPLIKEAVARGYIQTRRYWAHPNLLAREHVVPELVGRVTATDIAAAMHNLLRVPLPSLQQRLRMVMGNPGASDRLVSEVLELATR